MNRIALVDPSGKAVVFSVAHNKIININITDRGLVHQAQKIEQLNLNPATIVKEFPDLRGQSVEDIKREGVRRFYEHISKMKTEEELKNYIVDDLTRKHGYNCIGFQKDGFRFVKYKKNGRNNILEHNE